MAEAKVEGGLRVSLRSCCCEPSHRVLVVAYHSSAPPKQQAEHKLRVSLAALAGIK
jgi:hypothetical protein